MVEGPGQQPRRQEVGTGPRAPGMGGAAGMRRGHSKEGMGSR
jgi:hypothetical protein